MIKHESILVFDMDNTLVFTNQANFLSYKEAVNIVLDRDITATLPLYFL